jgi:phage tail tape-measure protein
VGAKAVDAMYLVDLDDSNGLTLTITVERNDKTDDDETFETSSSDAENKAQSPRALVTDVSFQAQMKKILEQARADMDTLAMDHGVIPKMNESMLSIHC